MSLYYGSRASLGTLPSLPSSLVGLPRNALEAAGPRQVLPALCIRLQDLIETKLKAAYRATTAGKFSEALEGFLSVVYSLPLVVVDSKKEANEVCNRFPSFLFLHY